MDKNLISHAANEHRADILEPFGLFMELYGFEAVCALCENFSGSTVYIPTLHTVFKRCLEREAAKEFDGANYGQLARKYGFSERHIRGIMSDK